jgi:hypothetical protein
MHQLSSAKTRSHNQSSKPHRIFRPVAGLLLAALGAGLSIHLFAIHASYWWLPLLVFLVLAHGAIVGGLAWLTTRHRHDQLMSQPAPTGTVSMAMCFTAHGLTTGWPE